MNNEINPDSKRDQSDRNRPELGCHDDAFLEKATYILDQSADDLDRDIVARLNDVRRQALQSHSKTKFEVSQWFAWGGIGGGVAVASLITAFWLLNPVSPLDMQEGELTAMASLSDDDIDMLEDIEFVAWLMEQEENNAG